MNALTLNLHAEPSDKIKFQVGKWSDGSPHVWLVVGDLSLCLDVAQLIAVRVATGQALVELKAAQQDVPKLTEHEDGDSLRNDQFDREQGTAA